jgi:transposase InsO family protein
LYRRPVIGMVERGSISAQQLDPVGLGQAGQVTEVLLDLPVADNVLDRQFDPQGPNARWVSDITYTPTREGWLYLAVVEDLYSRRVVGWALASTMTSRLVVDALQMAVQRRLPGEGLLSHSDRGSQYASEHYQRLLAGQRWSAGTIDACKSDWGRLL